MARTVFCQKLQKEADGLDFQLYPGEIGERIFNNLCKEAWAQWQHKQTMLINEKHLNRMVHEHRAFLEAQMVGFLLEGNDVEIEGYRPPEK